MPGGSVPGGLPRPRRPAPLLAPPASPRPSRMHIATVPTRPRPGRPEATLLLPSRDIMLARLVAVLDHPQAVAHCYPQLLRAAERSASGQQVAVMVGAAIYDCALHDRSGDLGRLLAGRFDALLTALVGRRHRSVLAAARAAWRALGGSNSAR